jgi:hypothetical protein
VARSPGFREEWLEEAAGLVVGFGDRPAGVKCPAAVFAHPLGRNQVAVVQVADREPDESGWPVTAFHISTLPQRAYERSFGDPFLLARQLPPAWGERDLPSRTLSVEPMRQRTVEDIQRVLKRIKASALREDQDPEEEPERTPENSESPALLGGAQVLMDGGRIVFVRPVADSGLVPDLWTLLPNSTRCKLWPASFAFGNALGFDALVVSRALGADFEGYIREEEAAEYPEGQYEYNLQAAAEHSDQQALNALLSRRSWAQTWRLALGLLVLLAVVAVVLRVGDPDLYGPVTAVSDNKKVITMEILERGEHAGSLVDIRITDRTKMEFQATEKPEENRPLVGYFARVWLERGSVHNAATIRFTKPRKPGS